MTTENENRGHSIWHHYLRAALRSLARNKLHAGISIAGLAIGFAAALLIALFVRNELSYDGFLPGHERTYLLANTMTPAGREPAVSHKTPTDFARWLKLEVPGVESAARVGASEFELRRGPVQAREKIYWADPVFLELMKLPMLRGNPRDALARPESVVLTRTMAQKYFGDANPLGATLELNFWTGWHPLTVTAVLEDLPRDTHLSTQIIVSRNSTFGQGPISDASADEAVHGTASWTTDGYVYFRTAPGADITTVRRSLPGLVQRHRKPLLDQGATISLDAVPLTSIHLYPENSASAMRPTTNAAMLWALAGIAFTILLVACINFVNLMTARAARRATEVGIRKVCGAQRRNLIAQFIGEAVLVTALGMVVAIALVELALPALNAFLDRGIAFDYLHEPPMLAAMLLMTLLIGFLAGLYPALVLSSFRPAGILRGFTATGGSAPVRQTLVAIQFAVLIGLMLAALVIERQTQFALNKGLRVDKDLVLLVEDACKGALKDEVARLTGVRSVACSSGSPLSPELRETVFLSPARRDATMAGTYIDFGYLELYGLAPLAGRFFSRGRGIDTQPFVGGRDNPVFSPGYNVAHVAILNEAAVRALGYAAPREAVGRTFSQQLSADILQYYAEHDHLSSQEAQRRYATQIEIVGVVSDYSLASVYTHVAPTAYFPGSELSYRWLNVKLAGQTLPDTLARIDALWKRLGEPRHINRIFLSDALETQYLSIRRESALLAAFSGIALLIACLGLFTLSAYATERRTREIGVRKALGADRNAIMQLLLLDFSKPVLLANVLAWPAAYYFMRRWLEQFAYRIELEPWMFLAAGAAALVIALLTVLTHTVVAARALPAAGLRE